MSHYIILYYIILYYIILYYIRMCCMMMLCVLYDVVLYYVILCCVVLCYVMLCLGIIHLFHRCFASMEICDHRNNITMCPLCDRACSYWKLVTACGTARASHLFDNPATVFFSIFMALWGKDTFTSNQMNRNQQVNR